MLAGGVNITTENITTEQHEDYPTELSQELEFKYASNEPDDVNEHKNKKNILDHEKPILHESFVSWQKVYQIQ